MLPDPSEAIERARVLRGKAIAAVEALAANEDQIARIHEELAASLPERRGEYQRTAEQARGRTQGPRPRAQSHRLIAVSPASRRTSCRPPQQMSVTRPVRSGKGGLVLQPYYVRWPG